MVSTIFLGYRDLAGVDIVMGPDILGRLVDQHAAAYALYAEHLCYWMGYVSMSRISQGILVLLISLTTGDGHKREQGPSPGDRLASIQKEHKDAEADFYKAFTALEDTPQGRRKGEELRKACHKGEADRFLTAVDIAKADPKSDVGFAALEWVTKAVDQLLKDIR